MLDRHISKKGELQVTEPEDSEDEKETESSDLESIKHCKCDDPNNCECDKGKEK